MVDNFSSGVNGVSALHNSGLESAEANGDNPLHGAVAKHNLKQAIRHLKLGKTLSHLSVLQQLLKMMSLVGARWASEINDPLSESDNPKDFKILSMTQDHSPSQH